MDATNEKAKMSTKGPWTLALDTAANAFYVQAGSRGMVDICQVLPIRKATGANGNLIAAAPAYALAWGLVPEEVRQRIFDALHKPDTEWVEAAIAKAEGEVSP